MIPPPPRSTRTDTLLPHTARFRSARAVDFAGAALSGTSAVANATGITTQDGTDVTITTAANAATGNGAAVTVNAAGGLATGISIAGASGAESVTLGDAFTVTNRAGSAKGIILPDGSSQTVLSGGLNVARSEERRVGTEGGSTGRDR